MWIKSDILMQMKHVNKITDHIIVVKISDNPILQLTTFIDNFYHNSIYYISF